MDADEIDETALLMSRIKALAAFETAMAEASERLAAAQGNAMSQRVAGIAAIDAVLKLMDACDVSLRLAGPLNLIGGALDGLNVGRKPSFFDPPTRPPKRPKASGHEWTQRAIVAAALELRRRELGHGKQCEAAAWVVGRTKRWAIWPSYNGVDRSPDPSRTLNDWRKALNKRPLGDAGRRVFAYYTDPASGLTAEAVLTREATCWGIPGVPAPKDR